MSVLDQNDEMRSSGGNGKTEVAGLETEVGGGDRDFLGLGRGLIKGVVGDLVITSQEGGMC